MGRKRQQDTSRSPRRKRGFRPRRRKVCYFCTNPGAQIDFKDVDQMRKFTSDRGKIQPRRRSGTCPKHQRELARQVKKSREIALIPYTIN